MKKKTNDWFVVDNQGMSRMYGLYNKNFVVRELLQNAFDEDITKCSITLEWQQGVATIMHILFISTQANARMQPSVVVLIWVKNRQ